MSYLMSMKKKNLHLVQPHRDDEDDDSAGRSYKIVHQRIAPNKLKSTPRFSAKTMDKMSYAAVSCQSSSHTV